MQTDPTQSTQRPVDGTVVAFIVIIAATALASALGGLVSGGDGDPWYNQLDRAPGNPPGFVFGLVWPALYVLMAVGACLVWRSAGWQNTSRAMILYFTQLGLNLAWSVLFFGLHKPLFALIDMAALWVLVLFMIGAFRKHHQFAALLQLPYLAWLTFAAYLNAWIVLFN